MSKIAEKIAELEYNEQVALAVVEGDDNLRDMYLDEIKVKSFPLLRTLIKNNQFKQESKDYLREVFDKIILASQNYLDKYKSLLSEGDFEDSDEAEEVLLSNDSEIKPVKVEASFTVSNKDVKKTKNENKLPRRYGKEKIMADIEAQGGKSTSVQNAMLKVNELKNLQVTLFSKGIKCMLGGSTILTDEDSRLIVSAITTMQRQLKEIINKKR